MWPKINLPFAIFCLVLSTFAPLGVHAAKKMPTVETLFSAAYLGTSTRRKALCALLLIIYIYIYFLLLLLHADSPVFNLDDGSLWVSDIQNDRVLRLLDVSPKTDAAKRLAGTKGSNKEKKELADLVMSPPAPIRRARPLPSPVLRRQPFLTTSPCVSGGAGVHPAVREGLPSISAAAW
jgi:hypothetical protein